MAAGLDSLAVLHFLTLHTQSRILSPAHSAYSTPPGPTPLIVRLIEWGPLPPQTCTNSVPRPLRLLRAINLVLQFNLNYPIFTFIAFPLSRFSLSLLCCRFPSLDHTYTSSSSSSSACPLIVGRLRFTDLINTLPL